MALAYTKAGWSFAAYKYAYAQSARALSQNWYFSLKQVLVDLGWTVRGGYTASQGLHHNDGSNVDPWLTPADLRRDSQDFYIIMRGPLGLGDVEICFGSNVSNSETWWSRMFFYVSHNSGGTGGFGATYGGANGTSGTNSVPPTALDAQTLYVHNSTTNNTTANLNDTFSVYGAVSNDNKETRLVMSHGNVVNLFLGFSVLNNPHANLDNGGRVFTLRSTTDITLPSNTVMDNDFYTTPLYYGRVAGVNRTLYTGTSGYANLGHQSLNIVQQDNKMVVSPMDMYNNTLGEKGYYGTIPDMYWGNNAHEMQLLGDTVGGVPNWFSGGSIISPWDGVTPEPLPRVH